MKYYMMIIFSNIVDITQLLKMETRKYNFSFINWFKPVWNLDTGGEKNTS